MTTRVRTINFLPEIFQTKTNTEFLSATLDQLVNPPLTRKIQGYVGSKIGYGINANDYYVVEPTKTRTDYQLDPGVIFTKVNESTAQDFISYPGLLDALKMQGGITNDNSRLFESQIYSWDSFTDLDKIINYNQYYWLPVGPPTVTVSPSLVYDTNEYTVTDATNTYQIKELGSSVSVDNPTITLLRGGTYEFIVDQDTQFWIQGEPGTSGYSETQPNLSVRDILGVTNNGASQGVITFTVPQADAQDEYLFPGNNLVDVVSTSTYANVNGALLSSLGSIDGITSLDGLRLMFYTDGVSYTGSQNFYRIQYTGSLSNPTITLVADGLIPIEQKITVSYGTQWINRNFYRNTSGVVSLIPYISATLTRLYYQDGTSENKVGVIRLIEDDFTDSLNVETEILGQKNFTSTNGVVFTNGLKVKFSGDVIPTSYLSGEYYVEGVGTAIQLIPANLLVCPEAFTTGTYILFDSVPYDTSNFDSDLFVPTEPDYVTIARQSINKNAWSRSNRWFHIDVIRQTAVYNNNPDIVTTYAKAENKAKRPIIEFYPNLKLFNSGTEGKNPVDFIDQRSTDALSQVAGLYNYYPDTEVSTENTASIAGVTGTSTTITVPTSDITGTFQVGQYISDFMNVLPNNTQISAINVSGINTLLTVTWSGTKTIPLTNNIVVVAADTTLSSFALFTGARIIFAADDDVNVRNKIYVATITQVTPASTPIITLAEALDSQCEDNDQTVIIRGYNNQGNSFYFDGDQWIEAQEKTNVNQSPLFDIFDENGISFSDSTVYQGTSFAGCKLFAYGIGSGVDDVVLGFPIRYSSINNVGDISFDVSINSDTFDYVTGTNPVTQKVNTGYVFNYDSRTTYTRELGWQTAIAPSAQYQVFEFQYLINDPSTTFVCDIAAISPQSETAWASVQVFINNACTCTTQYTYTVTDNTTIVELLNTSAIEEDTTIQVLVLSNQVSSTSYYTIPANLNNNPFNQDLETLDMGDIRLQYRDIYLNAPGIVGQVFGSNNFRDLGNLVPYGSQIIQNSASLVLPGAFLRKQNHNLFDALLFNSREYIKYKNLLVDTINNMEYTQRYTPSEILDMALDIITSAKNDTQAFFWSDMLPAKAVFRTNTYTFANSLDTSIYPLSKIYNFSSANYDGVLVYLTRTISGVLVQKQLIKNQDYTISEDSPSLTVTLDLIAGDRVTVKEYNQTYGSYAPNTPTKLGLYPASIPSVVLDTGYTQPTYFIKGHDGSYNKLYGSYDTVTGTLDDFRDQGLLEFELRVYNNLKLSNEIPIQAYEVIPGFFRDTDYTYNEFIQMYSESFLNWVGQNRLDYKTQYYNKNNEYTYNYNNAGNKLDNSPIEQGYWRGVYQYFYDTTTPDTTPWEMLGFANKPSWWEERYGPAPYTSDNLILWTDLEQGIIWNNGTPITVDAVARPGLTNIIPVDSAGDLVSPFISIMSNYNPNTFQKDWKVGDVGPVELSYRRSSSYPFDLMRLFALMKPAKFFNLGVDLDNYKYNAEFNQYLVNNRSHLVISDVEIYGSGTAKTSYVNWIVDYEKQIGVDATQQITELLDNLDVRLVYRLAGYSDKTLLKFYVEKGTPNSTNASLLIPDESYSLLLYDNQAFDKIVYSGIVVQIVQGGYLVFGNSQTDAYFKTLKPLNNGAYDNIEVENDSVKVAVNYTDTEVLVPYSTKFYSTQEVAQFLASYGAYLTTQGVLFTDIISGVEVNWNQMIQEFLYWTQTGWEVGSIITLNPSAKTLKIDRENSIVQPLTFQQTNFVLNQNLYPIQAKDLSVLRDGTAFSITALNQGDAISYGQFSLSNFEHGVIFNNETVFNDTIYNLVTGLRQSRIYTVGTKTAEWNGTVTASGFILNQDNIQEWSRTVKYTKGSIVKYKNKYWTALKVVEPAQVFNEREWKETDYDQIQKGLLPNPSTRSYESALYYNTDKANLEQDADLLSYSLIGYRPRDYLAVADLTDVTQINVYKNLIKNKGTRNAIEAFRGANLPQGGIEYQVYENWAIKTGEYGGLLNKNFVEFRVNQNNLTGNPSIVSLTTGTPTIGSQQEVPLYSLFNYAYPIETPDILSIIPSNSPVRVYPDAGYVNLNDVKMSSYFYFGLPLATNKNNELVPISDFYVRDYAWLANYLGDWDVLTWKPVGQVISVRSNLNSTATVTFAQPHGLSRLQPLSIINYAANVDGYYIVNTVLNLTEVIINLPATNAIATVGQGIGLTFQSQRVDKPSDINTLPLLDTEFTKNTVWVDENTDGSWAVYRKSLNYQYDNEVTKANSTTFGSAVAYTDQAGYIISDASAGEVYRYTKNSLGSYSIAQTVIGGASFGSKIAYAENTYIISEPTGTPSVHVYVINDTTLTTIPNQLVFCQEISQPGGITDWGSEVSISNDSNWLYISDIDNNKVHVYRKQNILLSAGYFNVGQTYVITEVGTTDFTLIGAIENKVGITFVATGIGSGTGTATQVSFEAIVEIDGSVLGLTSGDNFSKSITTNYYGDVLYVGAPNVQYSATVADWGSVYAYSRLVQNLEVQTNTTGNSAQTFQLGWTPTTVSVTVTDTSAVGNLITLSSVSGIAVNDPIIFSGIGLANTNIIGNYVYYIASISGSDITIKTSRSSVTAVTLLTKAGISNANASVQTSPLYVYRNGALVQDSAYGVIGSTFVYTNSLVAGDIITVSGNEFSYVQTLTSDIVTRSGIQFGYSIDTTQYGTELIVGSPYEINDTNQEGAVYRFTNGGGRFGLVTGTSVCNVSTSRTLFINGYLVTLPVGNATAAANTINTAKITNIQAAASADNKLTIQVINSGLASVNSELILTSTSADTFTDLGIEVYTQTQVINCPHEFGPTQFGSMVKFNEYNSFVVSAPVGTRYAGTTFDFIDDENIDNDTVFDNNATQFVDTYPNAGAVYMFDYLENYNESLSNNGEFIYAQSVNSKDLEYGSSPLYGTALDFNSNVVMIGTPNFLPESIDGQVTVYENEIGIADWSVYRSSSPVVDIDSIQNAQIFSAETNNTLINLDYIDPLQGKLLGSVRQNLDYVSTIDPANYNSPELINTQSGLVWGASKVGSMWFDTTNVSFINYHQNDNVYNSTYWGTVFPGSDVAVYTWVASKVTPDNYQGPGVPKDTTNYTVSSVLDASNIVVPVYYFWVRNANVVFRQEGKTLSDSVIESYIRNPKNSGISFFAPIRQNSFALYNCSDYINANDSVLHVGYATGTNDSPAHSEYTLIRENFADDFLPGLPALGYNAIPEGLYDRLLDSLSGVDEQGGVVPNPFLPKAVQSGILARPRQSFFYDRFLALKNYLTYANEILAQYPIAELRPDVSFLFAQGLYYNTANYWQYINWWADGYNNSTKSVTQVPVYADLSTLNVAIDTIVTVEDNGSGKFEVYRYDGSQVWSRIGLQNGTIEFKSSLWDYAEAKLGFGDNFFDTSPYDQYPSEETRFIIRALNEQIYIKDLLIFRNKSLILLFEYIQTEATESQNYLPWLNKTSLVDVSHTIRELVPVEVYKEDNQDFLAGYINEVKPYHVVIKEFIFKYTGTDTYNTNVTDFDLPAKYDSSVEQFITPMLVYQTPSADNEYLPTDDIWQTAEYTQWFQNKGVSLAGQQNYEITTLNSYMTIGSSFMFVDNIFGFPISGTIRIGTEEMFYSSVDRSLGLISGLVRGLNGTTITTHIPGEKIFIDLPEVVVLDGGRGYVNPPRITAYIDLNTYPAPTREAVLEPVMSLDKVSSVRVIDPGQGYMVLPEIRIEPANIVTFTNSAINSILHTVTIYAPTLETGDSVLYKKGENGAGITNLLTNQWYYVNVLETVPTAVVAFYTNYSDAVSDRNRIQISDNGTDTALTLSLGARASTITSASPVRENNITIRFDRTTYTSQVQDWRAGGYYGSFFAGTYFNSENVSSSSIQLESVLPPISSILASAQGAVFEIVDVDNDRQLTWSSLERVVGQTINATNAVSLVPLNNNSLVYSSSSVTKNVTVNSTTDFSVNDPIIFTNMIVAGATVTTFGNIVAGTTYYIKEVVDDYTIKISTVINGSVFDPGTVAAANDTSALATAQVNTNASGSTIGFYVGMPVKFIGTAIGGLASDAIYYVKQILSDTDFTVSLTDGGAVVPLTSVTATSSLKCLVGEVVDTAILTVNYPGIVEVTATQAGTNALTVPMSLIGTGGTQGFYTNIPVFFTGNVFGGIIENEVYYVTTVIDNQTFTLSETEDPLSATVTAVTNTITLSSVIITGTAGQFSCAAASETLVVGQSIVISGTLGGTGSISGYTNPTTYYIIETNGSTTFTLSTSSGGTAVTTTAGTPTGLTYIASSNRVTVSSTTGFEVNDPIIFTNMTVAGASATSFGNIVAGTTYYVSQIVSTTQLKISTLINGGVFNPGTVAAASDTSALLTSQADTLTLSTATGSMTMNVSLPVSPGQVNGQQFTLYNTSIQYPNITGTNESLIERTLSATIDTVDRIAVNPVGGDLDSFYVNMPVRFDATIGGITSGVTYYVIEYSGMPDPLNPGEFIPNIQVEATSTSSTGNLITCDTNESLYVGMPIIFSGSGMGGIVIGVEYFVESIVSTNQFTISDTAGGPVKTLTNDTGIMIGTGDPYIIVSSSKGGSALTLSNSTTPFGLEQYITSTAQFDVSYILGGYRALVSVAGEGYAVNNTISIAGNLIGGTTPTNDLLMTVNSINDDGGITDVICSGTVPGVENQYYLKVISPNQLEVYSNSLMTVPVSGIGFNYSGFTTTTATDVTASNDRVTVTSSADFAVNDAVVFTGTMFSAEITLGQTYYIFDKPTATTVRLTTAPGGSVINFASNASGTMTMAKAGSFALLPEPFYFNQSIVKFNNRVYVCVVSNNDDEFVFGKWELLDPADRRLNAMDRAIGYYQPTANMPGVDLTQLFEGVTYPNSTYLGNPFAPAQQFELDTILETQPFYPTDIDISSVVWNGTSYLAAANLPNYSATLGSQTGSTWAIAEITNAGIGLSDIIRANGIYVMTSTNSATPVLRSADGITWTTTGILLTETGPNPIQIASLSLNSVTYSNGLYVASGSGIVTSSDTYDWITRLSFTGSFTNTLYGVSAVTTSGFTGFVSVGKGQISDPSSGAAIDTNLIYYSNNGTTWNSVSTLTPNGLNGVTSDSSTAVAVGEQGVIYYSQNGTDWLGVNEVGVLSVNSATDQLILTNTAGFAINDIVRFTDNLIGSVTTSTSSTSLSIGTGSKSLTISSGLSLISSQEISLIFDASNKMEGTVTSYDSGTGALVVNVTTITGSGTYSSWTVTFSYIFSFIVSTSASSTSLSIGTGSKSLTIPNRLNLGSNQPISLIFNESNKMEGTITSYDSITGALVVNVTTITGSGTYSSWSIQPSYYIVNIVSSTQVQISTSSGGPISTLLSGTIPYRTRMFAYPTTSTLNDIAYGNGRFIAVGNTGRIITSTNGITWTVRTSGTTENLRGITYKSGNEFIAVGENDTVLLSSDNGVTWTSSTLFTVAPPIYDIQGDAFTSGYAPEELVAGVVSDNLTLIVNTRPGTNWPETEYAHTGYNVVSLELPPENGTQTVYSFANAAQYPAQIYVAMIDGATKTSTTLHEGTDYTIDWVNLTVILPTPISLASNDVIRIDVYEVGNGDQLVKSNTRTDPIRENSSTGFNEIYLNCNYSASIFAGSGAVRPSTLATSVYATATEASTNRIVCDSVEDFILNEQITFQGTVFGGIVEDQHYYVKSISTATNSITISDTLTSGTAGPIFALSDGSGSMLVSIDAGPNLVWTDPIAYHNGTKLILGVLGTVVKTSASNNAITTITTSGLVANQPIKFCQCALTGSNIDPLTTYYVHSIVDSNEFKISDTQGGSVKVLGNSTGSSMFITNDYAIGITENEITAKLVFAAQYENTTDYLVYSVFGETFPVQYGYTIPETQTLIGDGANTVFNLTNYVGNDNVDNAIVEISGLRVLPSTYTIDSSLDTITFTSAPAANSVVTVTSFNDTQRQYLNTQVISVTTQTVSPIVSISNEITLPLATTRATASTAGAPNQITVDSTTGFVNNATVQFKGTSFDANIVTDGTVYFVENVVNSTTFTIKDENNVQIVTAGGAGSMQVVVGGTPAVRVTTSVTHGFSENDIVKIDGVTGSVQLNDNTFYAKIINSYVFDLYQTGIVGYSGYDPAVGAINYPITSISAYTGGGYTWLSGSYYLVTQVVTNTTTSTNRITVTSTSKLVEGTPVIFTGAVFGGIVAGTTYYILDIVSSTQFTISATRGGSEFALSTAAGSMNVTQWAQSNVDRLWVTVNGERVPSSQLRISSDDEVSILAEVSSGDDVIITSMMPHSTPDEEIYLNFVNKSAEASVYRANIGTRTWLTQPIYDLSTEIYVDNASRLTNTIVQTETVPAAVSGYYNIGLNADKNIITSITVYNNATGQYISSDYFELVIESLSPILKITPGSYVTVGQQLTITVLEGNLIYVNGEQIRFGTVNLTTNTLGQIQRGVNGTSKQTVIPEYTEVFGLLSKNRLSDVYYNQTWNSNVYNTVSGDPLQISETTTAEFLNTDNL